jgi:hypothetical protein
MADLAHAKENDIDLHGDFDAAHWAERFVVRVRENPAMATDEGAMLSWFAGAIMTGHDHAKMHLPAGRDEPWP